MAVQGIVSPLVAEGGNVIGSGWVQSISDLSPSLQFVRAPIGAMRDGSVPTGSYSMAVGLVRSARLDLWAVLEESLGPSDLNPNDALGYDGNPFLNRWIDGWSLRALAVSHQLGLTTAWALNEPNLQAAPNFNEHGVAIPALTVGEVADSRKGRGAMDPRVFFSALYQFGLRAKKLAPELATIFPAALSVSSKFRTSEYDAWVGGYIDADMTYLVDNGATPPWPWTGFSANMEGAPDQAYVDYTMAGYAKHKQDHGVVGPTIVGEWSVPNSSYDVAAMKATFDALNSRVYAMAFFQFPTLSPGDAGTYGCTTYSFEGGLFVPRVKTPWYEDLSQLLNGR